MRIIPLHTDRRIDINASLLVGTWEFCYRFMSDFRHLSALKVYDFRPDKTGVYSHLDNLEEVFNDVVIFTYSVNKDRITLVYEAESRIDTILFSVEQDRLTLVNYNNKEIYSRNSTENK